MSEKPAVEKDGAQSERRESPFVRFMACGCIAAGGVLAAAVAAAVILATQFGWSKLLPFGDTDDTADEAYESGADEDLLGLNRDATPDEAESEAGSESVEADAVPEVGPIGPTAEEQRQARIQMLKEQFSAPEAGSTVRLELVSGKRYSGVVVEITAQGVMLKSSQNQAQVLIPRESLSPATRRMMYEDEYVDYHLSDR